MFRDTEQDRKLTGNDFGHFVVILADFDGKLNVKDGKGTLEGSLA